MRHRLVAALLCAALMAPSNAYAAIRISDAQPDSIGADTGTNKSLNGEWIRIKNTGSRAKSLRGWTLRNAAGNVYKFGDFKLGAGNTTTVRTGRGSNTSGDRYWDRTDYKWRNSKDTATLRNASGSTVDKRVMTAPAPCISPTRPKYRVSSAFSNAKVAAGSNTAAMVEKAVCSAARGSQIRIAMFWITNTSTATKKIVNALRWVKEQRGVRIRIVMDTMYYKAAYPKNMETLKDLRTFADVVLCVRGCRSVLAPEGTTGGSVTTEANHNKFLVVDDTVWKSGTDPLTYISSANWAPAQLSDRYQSSVMVWNDVMLAKRFSLRWDNLNVCARQGCSAWNQIVDNRGLSVATHGVRRIDDVWHDRTLQPWQGDADRGTAALFSPVPTGDPIAEELGDFEACAPDQSRVWVGQRYIAKYRKAVIDELVRLDKLGCDVRIIVGARTDRDIAAAGAAYMKAEGLSVQCVAGIHDKYLLVDALDDLTRRKLLLTGSQGLGARALMFSDESMLRLTTGTGSPAADTDNARVWQAFAAHHRTMADQSIPCPS